jgi:hypothetical protein
MAAMVALNHLLDGAPEQRFSDGDNREKVANNRENRWLKEQDLFVFPDFRVVFDEQHAFSFDIGGPFRYQ